MLPILDLGLFQVPSFFLVLSIVMGFVFYLTVKRARKLLINEYVALDFSLILMLSAMIGARLGHVIFENPEYYWQQPIRIFYFWEGGFIFYGGFILSFASGVLYLAINNKLDLMGPYMRLYAPILAVSYAIGRVGCFLEGCCYGKTCRYFWAIDGRHPTQIYSTLGELALFVFLLVYENRNPRMMKKYPERLFFFWLLFHSVGRGLIEFLRDDFRGKIFIFSLSTWISLILFAIACVYFFRNRSVRV